MNTFKGFLPNCKWAFLVVVMYKELSLFSSFETVSDSILFSKRCIDSESSCFTKEAVEIEKAYQSSLADLEVCCLLYLYVFEVLTWKCSNEDVFLSFLCMYCSL